MCQTIQLRVLWVLEVRNHSGTLFGNTQAKLLLPGIGYGTLHIQSHSAKRDTEVSKYRGFEIKEANLVFFIFKFKIGLDYLTGVAVW